MQESLQTSESVFLSTKGGKPFVVRSADRRVSNQTNGGVCRMGVVMTYWVYLLLCADGSYYTGHTDSLENRIAEHHAGKHSGYTSRRRPLELAFSQAFPTREEALAAERQIKGWSRKKKEALIQGDWMRLSQLAQRNRG